MSEYAGLNRSTTTGRLALAGVTIGSGAVMLDASVVFIALRILGEDLGASMADLQWVVNGYVLVLAALILVGGSLGDHFGRRRVYLIGVVWFTVASLLCAMAQNPGQLVAARVFQGVGGALMTPGALALIQANFRKKDRSAAIGTWAGYAGVATAIGPFLGGWILDHASWRWIFIINVPLCIGVFWLTWRFMPESRDDEARGFDAVGALLTIASLGLLTWALTGPETRPAWVTVTAIVLAVAAGVGFVLWQRRTRNPLVPLSLFASRVFSAANGMTLLVYGALGAVSFFLILQLQVVSGYSALVSGIATLPMTILLMLLSSRFAVIAEKIGPRIPMSVGPVICAVGAAMLVPIGPVAPYWTSVFPGVLVFAFGLATLVSPLTAAVLAAAPDRHAGVASGINNAVARSGSLLAIAALPALVGLTGSQYADPRAMAESYPVALWACAGLLFAGGVVSWFGLGRREIPVAATEAQPDPAA